MKITPQYIRFALGNQYPRLEAQRNAVIGSTAVLTADEAKEHLDTICWALAAIHFERQSVAYRQESRRMLERWITKQPISRERIAYWYGVILTDGTNSELESVFHVWRAVGMESVKSILRSIDNAADAYLARQPQPSQHLPAFAD